MIPVTDQRAARAGAALGRCWSRVARALVACGCVVMAVAQGAGVGAANPVARTLPRLTLRQLVGQRVIYSYPGLTPPATLLSRIRAGEAAGVILFASNISSRAQIGDVIDRLQAANAASAVRAPLLIMTDQEGGLVRRLPGAPSLSEKQIGASAHPLAAARAAGRGAGRNLRGVGINVNLAPVLDVFRAPGDFIDRFGRSYSRDPQAVARLGAAFIGAQQATGVAATAKHFPGLGAATRFQDTDRRPVTLDVPLGGLRATDELPYRSAVSAGVRLVMVSWARYPALDDHRPAGLSATIVRDELRRRMGFAGVTITDALGAGALRSYGTVGHRAVLAARAGMDLMLCAGQRIDEATSTIDGLAAALAAGRLDIHVARAAAARVIALRSAVGA